MSSVNVQLAKIETLKMSKRAAHLRAQEISSGLHEVPAWLWGSCVAVVGRKIAAAATIAMRIERVSSQLNTFEIMRHNGEKKHRHLSG